MNILILFPCFDELFYFTLPFHIGLGGNVQDLDQ